MTPVANPYQKYKQQNVLMANPVELIIMLYDGCIKQLKLTRIAIEKKNYEESNLTIQKSQNIILELINSLDMHYPIADELLHLYEFMFNQMVSVNTNKDTQLIQPIIDLLSELRVSWTHVLKENKLIEHIG